MRNLPKYALCLRQPWCHAVLILGKDVENRRWRSCFRGRVVIHASQTLDPIGLEYLRHAGFEVPEALPRGAYVGEVTVAACVPASNCDSPSSDHGATSSNSLSRTQRQYRERAA